MYQNRNLHVLIAFGGLVLLALGKVSFLSWAGIAERKPLQELSLVPVARNTITAKGSGRSPLSRVELASAANPEARFNPHLRPSMLASSRFYRFEQLEAKILKSPSQARAWKELLTNRGLLSEALARVQGSPMVAVDPFDEHERFAAVRFVGAALFVDDPAVETEVLQQTVPLLSMPRWNGQESLELRQSLLADRLELFALVARKSPETIEILRNNALSERQKKFIDLAQKWARYRFGVKQESKNQNTMEISS